MLHSFSLSFSIKLFSVLIFHGFILWFLQGESFTHVLIVDSSGQGKQFFSSQFFSILSEWEDITVSSISFGLFCHRNFDYWIVFKYKLNLQNLTNELMSQTAKIDIKTHIYTYSIWCMCIVWWSEEILTFWIAEEICTVVRSFIHRWFDFVL